MRKTASANGVGSCKLTARDTAILGHLLEAGGWLPFEWLSRRHFPSRKKAHRRLKLLNDHGHLDRRRDGNDLLYYGLTARSAEAAAAGMGLDPRGLSMTKASSSLSHLRHACAIGRLRLALRQACEATGRFDVELHPHVSRARQEGSGGNQPPARGSFVPDLAFVLTDRQVSDFILRFVEVDCGTQTVKSAAAWTRDFSSKIGFYCTYYDSGGYQRDFGALFNRAFEGFICLVVSVGRKRLENLKQRVLEEGARDIFWFALLEDIHDAETVFQRKWETAGSDPGVKHSLVGDRLGGEWS